MRSQVTRIRRPLTSSELDLALMRKEPSGGENLNDVIKEISLEHVSLEERRKEANKPLYLVRYE